MAAFFPFVLVAVIFYLAGASWMALRLARKVPERDHLVRFLGLVALLAHAGALYGQLQLSTGLSLGLLEVISLANWLICTFLLLSSLRHPTLNLMVVLYPLAAIFLLVGLFSEASPSLPGREDGLLFHILASLSAYSLFALASVQALLLALQNYQLKHRNLHGLLAALPPLQTMERLLFDLLLAGQILLTLGIGSGFIFLDNMFAQSLVHKTLLAIAAWLTFGWLLVAHWRLGWRGMTAVRWTLGGSLLLLLAYFGSRFVLQVILGR